MRQTREDKEKHCVCDGKMSLFSPIPFYRGATHGQNPFSLWDVASTHNQVGYEALHRAGYSRETLRGSDTGIFVGACGTDWAAMLAEGNGPARGPYTRYATSLCVLATYVFLLFVCMYGMSNCFP